MTALTYDGARVGSELSAPPIQFYRSYFPSAKFKLNQCPIALNCLATAITSQISTLSKRRCIFNILLYSRKGLKGQVYIISVEECFLFYSLANRQRALLVLPMHYSNSFHLLGRNSKPRIMQSCLGKCCFHSFPGRPKQ